ncbi:Glycogen accumulation regulator GarA [Thermoflexales bacterium]|nr:Glycogen accumulation regulator GarA [Thermoflexales bacterium]
MTRPLKPRTSRLAPRLVVENGLSKGDEYIVRKPVTLIGRNESCDLIVSDPLVSRRHCQISWDGVYCTVEDLGSTNGTFVNGQQLTMAYALRPGDRLQVADVVFHFADPQATLVGHKWPKLKIERTTKRVSVDDELVELSTKEYALLLYLDEHSDRICSKEELGKAIWPEYKGDVFDYQVESLIKRLRQKLEPDAEESHLVVTLRGRGYRLIKP